VALNRPRPARLAVSIDELVLDGVAPGDPLVAQAIERAITQAMAERPASLQGVDDPAAIAAAAGAAVATNAGGAA
jgi:hypothetical protein